MGSITCITHGKKVKGNVGKHNPTIKLSFNYSTSRNGSTVSVALTSIRFWLPGSNSYYGYRFRVWASVGGSSDKHLITDKPASKKTWDYHPSNVTISKAGVTGNTVGLYIWAYAEDKKKCFSGATRQVGAYTISVPPYENIYDITYNSMGGVNGPDQPDKFSTISGVTITEVTPTYPITVDYHTTHYDPLITNREFLSTSWDTAQSPLTTETVFRPGESYPNTALTGNIEVFARWGNASYTPPDVTEPAIVTFNAMGGTVDPPQMSLERVVLGYAFTPGGLVERNKGVTYYSNEDLDLYPICNPATLQYSSLPTPIYSGYVFEGWYLEPTFENKVTTDLQVNSDIILYARYYKTSLWRKDADGTWHRLYRDDDFTRAAKVYECVEENGVKVWKKIAQVYRCIEENGTKRWEEM